MTLTRRQLLAGLPLAAATARPNVLIFLSDQESALLPGPVSLPNRRRIESHGVRFTHAFCNTPQCSAARSSLQTGLQPNETGVLTNVDGSSLGKPLPSHLPTIGKVFRDAGYSTGYFGKWHLGNDRNGLGAYGYDTFASGPDAEKARAAAEWIRQQRGPWLAFVSLINPHDIYQIPKVLRKVKPRHGVQSPFSGPENLDGKPPEQRWFVASDQGRQTRDFTADDWIRYRSLYCELTEAVDRHLGKVLDAAGDLAKTVAVYASDHGDALGEHGLPYKGPFMYEELIRIPLVIASPSEFSQPASRDDLVTSADVAPTVAALAGLRWPARISGQSLARPLKRDAVFLEYYAKQKHVNPIRTIRTRRWKLNWYDRGNKELYDLEKDPHELSNLASREEFRELQAQLEARLEDWRRPMINA